MHELFTQVLSKKDLSKAGDLFSVADRLIVNDLTEVVNKIREISSLSDYLNNDNDQSVVEICITRVTSAIRETGSIEQHSESLVALLESCLNHDLKPSSRDADPPHAKIASDVISCIFLNYGKREVLKHAIPIAVKFLHKGNRELSRNMSSYLSLAAIDNADLLAEHMQPVIDSVIAGNYTLSRVLPQIYAVNKEPLHDHVMALVSLLPLCDTPEKLSLLSLFGLIAKNKPSLLEPSLPQLCECLGVPLTANATLQLFLDLATVRPQPLLEHLPKMKHLADQQPNTTLLALQVIAAVSKLTKEKASEALDNILAHLAKVDHGSQALLLKEVAAICTSYPPLLTDKAFTEIAKHSDSTSSGARLLVQQIKAEYAARNCNSQVNQTSGGVTIVKVGEMNRVERDREKDRKIDSNSRLLGSRHKLAEGLSSRSATRLGSSIHMNRSMSRLSTELPLSTRPVHSAGMRIGSSVGLHKSMTRLNSSSQFVSSALSSANRSVTAINSRGHLPSSSRISSGNVTVTALGASQPTKSTSFLTTSSGSMSTLREDREVTLVSITTTFPHHPQGSTGLHGAKDAGLPGLQSGPLPGMMSRLSLSQSGNRLHNPSPFPTPSTPSAMQQLSSASPPSPPPSSHSPNSTTAPCMRRTNTSVTLISNAPATATAAAAAATQRISVFEPYPMRDTVQHFCEKHLDKIKSYMEKILVKIPLPAKCTIEERKSKKMAKLHFACQGRGEHCLYSKSLFTTKTRIPRIWIHLMFLAQQARSNCALSTRDTSVSSLKNCWDILKAENRSFLTLVTSAFPSAKDQETLLNELRNNGFFDVFEYNGPRKSWGCFLCNHPDRAMGFLQDTQPVIEGQLKEKKGRWKIFKRWRTRYFTLSGAHLSYRGSDDKEATPIEVTQIRSVKVSRGSRQIPKAFEIFTNDRSFVLKAKDGKNAGEWVQCLSIVVAQSQAKEGPTTKYPSIHLSHLAPPLRTTV